MDKESGWQRFRSHWLPATKHDLREMEQRITMKISELVGDVIGIKTQLIKIWGEQQAKYDALAAAYKVLEDQLADADLPQAAVDALTEVKAQLQAFDDTIPDVTP